jgi:flagellar hook-associated protein 1 FlgK
MLSLTTGLSALRASQTALDTIANNVANANDPNYHRQVTGFASRPGIDQHGLLVGAGVDAVSVRRLRDGGIANAISRNISEQNANASRLDIARQVETVLSPSVGSLNNRLDEFLNELERLTSNPHDTTSRRAVIQSADSLAREFNSASQQLTHVNRQVDSEISAIVAQVNQLAGDVADLNRKISEQELQGKAPNNLLDARDRVLNDLSQLIEARVEQQGAGGSVVILGDHGLIGQSYAPIEVVVENGEVFLRQSGDDTALNTRGGKLGGLVSGRNEITGVFQHRIDALAQQLVASINEAHATGVGLSGAFHQLQSTSAVTDASTPLSQVGLPFEAGAGSLFISVLDEATGERTSHEVPIDPGAQSLQDVASLISTIDHLQAIADSQTGKLSILAEPGFAFDFTGTPATQPQSASISGSAEPRFHGVFAGDANEAFSFSIPSPGTVGVTPGLTVEVKNSAGDLIATLDVGAGYEAGTPLDAIDGVSVSFSTGDFSAGDSFSTTLVAQPDTSGILVALGLNGLFVGHNSSTITVNSAIAGNPDLLATTRTGEAGDISNLESLIAVRNQLRFGESNATASAEMQDLVATTGFEVKQLSQIDSQLSLARENLDVQRNSLSGVDPNEELVRMLQFQRAFQIASRYISTVDQTLADLIAIVG